MNKIIVNSISDFGPSGSVYVVVADIDLGNNEEYFKFPADSTIIFDRGTISNGKIEFQNTTIEAPDYAVFINISGFNGSLANFEVNADWFGAATELSTALKAIIGLGERRKILLPRRYYTVASTITINQQRIEIDCCGTIVVHPSACSDNGCVFDLQKAFICLKIGDLVYEGSGEYSNTVSAIRLSGNVSYSTISVNQIYKFNVGIDLKPTLLRDKDTNAIIGSEVGVGIQYCKFYWHQINCTTCINIDLWSNTLLPGEETLQSSKVWVNENQFFGGRLSGARGIKVNHPSPLPRANADWINGNVFNFIGFEGITHKPISLYWMKFCEFHSLRMSESLPEEATTWIDMEYCSFLTFTIKSALYHRRVASYHCHQITLYGAFTDQGIGLAPGNTVLYIHNTNPNAFITDNAAFDYHLSTMHIPSRNLCKTIYYDCETVVNHGTEANPYRPVCMNFNDLFVSLYVGQDVLSDSCRVILHDAVTLKIDIQYSSLIIHPDMTLICELFGDSKIVFNNGTTTISEITTSGTYRVTSDMSNCYILKI